MRGEGYSLSDIAAATRSNSGIGGFGDDNGAWWIIILLVLFGNGRNGFGGFGGNSGVGENYVLATDFATIERKLDAVNNGICDSTFALNNTMTNGFAGVQQTLCQGFNGLNVAYLQGTNALSSQIADCCCTTQRGIDSINYNNAINTNTISRQISDCCCDLEKMNMQTRFDAQTYNCNTLQAIDKLGDRIIDRLTQDKIETLTNENQALRLRASQEAQNNFLISKLRPCPDPAYIVPNPNCCYNYTVTQNSCCGNGQFI
jgi:hypothetical protein